MREIKCSMIMTKGTFDHPMRILLQKALFSYGAVTIFGRSLRSRMNGHRSAIKKGGQSSLPRHFHEPDDSVDDMRVQILEKV